MYSFRHINGSAAQVALPMLLLLVLQSCTSNPQPAQIVYFEPPAHFPKPVYNFEKNTITQGKFELGRMLFYDPILSADSTIACSDCHQQFVAFAHSGHDLSHGINDQLTTRNSIAIFNLAWRTSFMWDGGINHIEIMPVAPIENPIEMGEKMDNVIRKLNRNARYRNKFMTEFKVDSVTSRDMLLAITQFMGSITSGNSKYDKHIQNLPDGILSASELNGKALVETHCSPCHSGILFTDQSFRNNGLDAKPLSDIGRKLITEQANDAGKFMVPTLRNIQLTAPYMHDGRFNTLEQVLEHYNSGIKSSPTLDSLLIGGIKLTPAQQADIIAFLQTLTDPSVIMHQRYSPPKP